MLMCIGKLLNSDYAQIAKLHCAQAEKRPLDADTSFPIEKARLQSAPWLIILAAVSTMAYGWSVQYRAVRLFVLAIVSITDAYTACVCAFIYTDTHWLLHNRHVRSM